MLLLKLVNVVQRQLSSHWSGVKAMLEVRESTLTAAEQKGNVLSVSNKRVKLEVKESRGQTADEKLLQGLKKDCETRVRVQSGKRPRPHFSRAL